MTSPVVQIVSECYVKPMGSTKESNHLCNLTPWDIAMLSMNYIQKGLLFKKPDQHDFIENLLDRLKQSLSLTLLHFYPLSGRLVTQKSEDPSTYSIFLDCNNNYGARFLYATLDMTISNILSPVDVPPIVESFFDLHKAVNHDGHTMPLLSIQVTELVDGVFIGCSMNHVIGDGTSYWNFFNTWSHIFQAQAQGDEYDVPILRQPIHNRWFPNDCSPPINLPFKQEDEFISRFEAPLLRERIFHFSAESIAKLKARANSEAKSSEISSFQTLSAHVWRCVTRARHMADDEITSCKLAINNRSRMEPALSRDYFGNAVGVVSAESTAGELMEHDLGWAAWKVHKAVANHSDRAVRNMLKEWLQCPVVYQLGVHFDSSGVTVSSSPRFDMYGNEFGMGKAVAVLSGYANEFDGNVTAYPGFEGGGSIDFEVSLAPHVMIALESNEEFMEAVSVSNPLH
uniref:Acetyltransferase At3g50280 family n=2 Tax=Cajanus cajan TaxID=3821 RepID=A0A151RI20_CAJCA|nr:putative acetyltransferase At3g50280 family [Cajanus cajan]